MFNLSLGADNNQFESSSLKYIPRSYYLHFPQAVVQQLIKLYTLWDALDVNPLPYHEVCPVCPGQLMMTTPRDLHYHLNTASHKVEESLVLDTPDTVATSSEAGASSAISRG